MIARFSFRYRTWAGSKTLPRLTRRTFACFVIARSCSRLIHRFALSNPAFGERSF